MTGLHSRRRRQGLPGTLRRDSILVIISNVVTGTSNYALSLVLLWVLPARQFSQVASIFALLLIAGTVAQAGVPWVVAREISTRSPNDPARSQAVGFGLFAAIGFGLACSAVIYGLSSGYASTGVEISALVTVPAVFVIQVGSGYLQGTRRFHFLAVLMALEALTRFGVGAVLAISGYGANGAVLGSASGALLGAAIAIWIVRDEIAWPRVVPKGLWQQLGGIGGVQVAVALLASLDVVVETVSRGTSKAFAGYQGMLIFARTPLFFAGALSTVVYPRLAKQSGSQDKETIVESTKLFLLTALLTVPVTASIPPSIITLVLPHQYGTSARLLLPLAVSGLACGQINFSSTLLQARSVFRHALNTMAVLLPVAIILLWLNSKPLESLAWTAAGMNCIAAISLMTITQRLFRRVPISRLAITGFFEIAVVTAVFMFLRSHAAVWVITTAALWVIGSTSLLRRGRNQRASS